MNSAIKNNLMRIAAGLPDRRGVKPTDTAIIHAAKTLAIFKMEELKEAELGIRELLGDLKGKTLAEAVAEAKTRLKDSLAGDYDIPLMISGAADVYFCDLMDRHEAGGFISRFDEEVLKMVNKFPRVFYGESRMKD